MGVATTATAVTFEDDTTAPGGDSFTPAEIAAAVTLPLGGAATWATTIGNAVIVRTGGTALAAADDERLVWGPGIQRNTRITSVADPNATMDKTAEATIGAAVLTASEFAQIDPGLIRAVYAATKNLQNGDGVGTQVTTFLAQDVRIVFLNTRTYSVSSVGQTNRWTKFGVKVQGSAGKPTGKNGVILDCGAAPLFRGNVLIYGSYIRNSAAGGITFAPGDTGLDGEIINCILETTSGGGNIVMGVSSSGQELAFVFNVDIILGGTGALTNFLATYAEKMTIAVTGSNPYCVNTAAGPEIKDLILIGTPTIADVRSTGFAHHYVNLLWTGNAPKFDLATEINEWSTYDPLTVLWDTGAIVPSVPLDLYDKAGVLVASGVSGAQGNIVFGAVGSIYENAVKVWNVLASVEDHKGPFRLVVNSGPNKLQTYREYEIKFEWRHRLLPSTYGRQYLPMAPAIPMYPAADPISLTADAVVRIETEVGVI